jgi:tetratricopeptide (TPR) repeat protein
LLSNKISSLFILSCFVFIATDAYSAEPHSGLSGGHFSKAALYYDEKKFDKAIIEYEDMMRSGSGSGNVYYNLGNCYLRRGETGKAILSYSRSRLTMPRDADLLANYRYALSLVKQKEAHAERLTVLKYSDRMFEYMTTYEAFWIFALFYIKFTIFFILSRFMKKIRMVSNFVAALSLSIVLITVYPLIGKIKNLEIEAIIIVPIADAKLEPVKEGESLFPLYDGMKVKIIKSLKNWHKIKRSDGKIGWISSSEIAAIYSKN